MSMRPDDTGGVARRATALAVSVLAIASAGCVGGGEAGGSPDSSGAEPAPAGAPSVSVDTVDVFLEEYLIDVPERLPPRVVLRVVNVGQEPHNLRIGPAGSGEWPVDMGDLNPGASRFLELELEPGTYDVICDLAGHDLRGMRTALEVGREGS